MNVPADGLPSGRRALLRWLGWFSFANGLIYAGLGLRYFGQFGTPESLLAGLYAVLAGFAHFSLLSIVPMFLLVGGAVASGVRWPSVRVLAVLVAAASIALLVLDANTFAERRFHLSAFTVALFQPVTWVFTVVVLLIAAVFQWVLADAVRGFVVRRPASAGGRIVGAVVALAFLIGQAVHVWADAYFYTPVTRLTQFLPAYFPISAKRSLARLGLVDPIRIEQARLLRQATATSAGDLRYPLNPLRCSMSDDRRLNIVWILVDALRPDVIVPDLLPTISAMKEGGQFFSRHTSGGNSSRAGIFSMFYGVPATYWQAFADAQRPPVLLDQLRAAGYQRLYASAAGFGSPTLLSRNVFAGEPGLPDFEGPGTATERNHAVTVAWQQWMARRSESKPFFAFLYYDPPMSDFGAPADEIESLPLDDRYGNASADIQRLWRQYRRAARWTDGEVKNVLQVIDDKALSDKTLVILASDHGYEFNDGGEGFVGHASNFSRWQLTSTLILRWPGREPRVFTHRSAHQDLPVTLLQEVFGCRNPPADYASGQNLFTGRSWDWLVAGSYHSHAIVEPGRVTVSEPGGFARILNPDSGAIPDATLDARLISESMAEQRRFFR